MRKFNKSISIGLLAVLMALGGCGGASVASVEGGRALGEGSIPIGRAQLECGYESNVRIVTSDGRIMNTVTRQQTIYTSVLPKGLTSIKITPQAAGYDPVTFVYAIGQDQFWAFNARPAERMINQAITQIESNFVKGQTFKVGDQFRLRIKVHGTTSDDAYPSVILSGGVSRLDGSDTITFTKAGNGYMFIKIAGIQRTYNFFVRS